MLNVVMLPVCGITLIIPTWIDCPSLVTRYTVPGASSSRGYGKGRNDDASGEGGRDVVVEQLHIVSETIINARPNRALTVDNGLFICELVLMIKITSFESQRFRFI
jgi:hypothetical protein